MSEIIDLKKHMKKKDNKISSSRVATEEQIGKFSENILKSMQEWILSKKPQKPDEKFVCLASIILTYEGGVHCIFDGVDDKNKLVLLGGLDLLKSQIVKNVENNYFDYDD